MMNGYRGRGGETECQALGAPIEEIMKAVEAAGTEELIRDNESTTNIVLFCLVFFFSLPLSLSPSLSLSLPLYFSPTVPYRFFPFHKRLYIV